jgi:hypothetical protein
LGRALSLADTPILNFGGFSLGKGNAGSGAGAAVDRDTSIDISPGQVRAARGFLGWSAEQLAAEAGVSFSTVRRVESPGERGVRNQSLLAIRTALERAGIGFFTGSNGKVGVTLK